MVAKVTVNVTPPVPALTITQPAPRTVLPPGDVTISVNAGNINLTENIGGDNLNGQGHLIYYMDVVAPTDPSKPATTASGTYVATSATSYTWHNVPAGTHTFFVQLVNNDNTPLSAPVVAKIVVGVATGATGGGP